MWGNACNLCSSCGFGPLSRADGGCEARLVSNVLIAGHFTGQVVPAAAHGQQRQLLTQSQNG